MEYLVVPLHRHPKYLRSSCDLINTEWKRSDTARLRSLEASSDELPTSLILLKENLLLGYLKLSPIPSIPGGCFVESVVIDKKERGKGYGRILMLEAEEYCRLNLKHLNVIYLSTKGQEGFYRKLGYTECTPISIYGSCGANTLKTHFTSAGRSESNINSGLTVPAPPPMPVINLDSGTVSKTYMRKVI